MHQILCWELVSKRGGAWILHYVKSAYAVTDVPDQVPELISQRRRWLNGSFFAAVHSTVHFHYLYRSSHTFVRKAWIHVEMFYQLFNLIFSWFALVRPHFSALGILLTRPAGELLHRVLDSVSVTGRHVVPPEWDQDSQRHPKLCIPRPAHHVLHPLPRQQATGQQVGVHGCDDWVCIHHGLHDGASPLQFPLPRRQR